MSEHPWDGQSEAGRFYDAVGREMYSHEWEELDDSQRDDVIAVADKLAGMLGVTWTRRGASVRSYGRPAGTMLAHEELSVDGLVRAEWRITVDLRKESGRQGANLYAACVMIKEEDDARSRAIFELVDRARAKFPDWVPNEELEKAREADAAIDPVVKKLLEDELDDTVEAPPARTFPFGADDGRSRND